ncbi:LYR motif-containing protein 4 isoform X1 [Halichoerus grypus]
MAASSRAQVLDLYRAMLRESKHFSAYNYRTYTVRRIRDAFRENKNVKDPVEIQALVNKAKRDLGIIRRQRDSESRNTSRASGRGRSRLPSEQGARCGARSQDPGTMTRAEGRHLMTEPPRRPYNLFLHKVHIGQMYSIGKLIIENQEKPRT